MENLYNKNYLVGYYNVTNVYSFRECSVYADNHLFLTMILFPIYIISFREEKLDVLKLLNFVCFGLVHLATHLTCYRRKFIHGYSFSLCFLFLTLLICVVYFVNAFW